MVRKTAAALPAKKERKSHFVRLFTGSLLSPRELTRKPPQRERSQRQPEIA
jgi:hypothetical protein